MNLMTLNEIRRAVQNGEVEARVHVQVESAQAKTTRELKPYCELALADACDRMTLRVWNDHPAYKTCDSLRVADFVELYGEFQQHQSYGLDAKRWNVRPLKESEIAELLQGPAAARNYHHARRGGLVEHTAQMMRVATKVGPLYPQLNLDLLLAGILFHDSGKLWENQLPENGFTMGYDERGELMGHISIGLELVNSIWRKLSPENAEAWKLFTPASEDVRLHLLHLIGAHHGEPEFGSPVSPKTPEAMALHYIDNLDARLEMFAAGYTTARPLAARIYDRVRPLPGNLVKSLDKFQSG